MVSQEGHEDTQGGRKGHLFFSQRERGEWKSTADGSNILIASQDNANMKWLDSSFYHVYHHEYKQATRSAKDVWHDLAKICEDILDVYLAPL